MMARVTVISLGGSLIVPAPLSGVDIAFLKGFAGLIDQCLAADQNRRLIIVCGGGSLARDYQAALREVAGNPGRDDQDWVGIAATRVNGELLARIFRLHCVEPVVTDPMAVSVFAGRILVAAGWKPGFSTDHDAVLLAQRFGADTLINLSNVAKVHSEDPRKNPGARPLDRISWKEMLAIVGEEWIPGKNTPFDPSAARAAAESRIRVVFAQGRDMENLSKILMGGEFDGTTIGPE